MPFSWIAGAVLYQVGFRPPAVPLVTSNPYLSIWSTTDRLTDGVTRHWTRRPHPLTSLIRIDGQTFRLMGEGEAPALPQTFLKVTPTQSIYLFGNEKLRVRLSFMTPLLPDDIDVLARPVTYLTWQVHSADKKPHRVSVLIGVGARLAVNDEHNPVVWSTGSTGGLTLLRTGAANQTILRPAGDDARINWGYAYLVSGSGQSTVGEEKRLTAAFAASGTLPPVDMGMPRPASDRSPTMAQVLDFGKVGSSASSRHAMVGYDEIYSIDYFGKRLRPYWRRNGWNADRLFAQAERDYPTLQHRCNDFDAALTSDATRLGGAKYAQLVALSYRQCLAANGLAADSMGSPLMFTKENTSNGDIATVDVFFPMAPILLLLNPTLMKASMESNFAYAASPRWKFPNAPHDLGTYPQVFGRDDGGEGMPVEESGNMIILADAVAHAERSPKYATRWWPQLAKWAKYLERYGLDPENQLCTDDFMGHLAHNANLSVKAIVALAAYGDLCNMRGLRSEGARYMALARADAKHWMQVAGAGDHSLLAFDKPNTWSQKYNLVWDRLLGLNVFPREVARREVAYYKTKMQPYGLPLDSRTKLTKSDWTVWVATMAESRQDFESFIDPIYRYLNETSTRDPIADSYYTDNVNSGGMHARPVVGGFFIKLLADPRIWQKWAGADKKLVTTWGPLPKPPLVEEVVPTSQRRAVEWRFTTTRPSTGWRATAFDDSGWETGPGGFGTRETPNAIVGTRWTGADIWLRRSVKLPRSLKGDLNLMVYHDEDVEVYIDGELALSEQGYENSYRPYPILPRALAKLKPGATVVLAVHCHQTGGGQGVDVGIARVIER